MRAWYPEISTLVRDSAGLRKTSAVNEGTGMLNSGRGYCLGVSGGARLRFGGGLRYSRKPRRALRLAQDASAQRGQGYPSDPNQGICFAPQKTFRSPILVGTLVDTSWHHGERVATVNSQFELTVGFRGWRIYRALRDVCLTVRFLLSRCRRDAGATSNPTRAENADPVEECEFIAHWICHTTAYRFSQSDPYECPPYTIADETSTVSGPCDAQ